MIAKQPETATLHDPDALLEHLFIEEYLRSLGYDPHCLHELPDEVVYDLRAAASTYASDRLAEIEARAGFVKETLGVNLGQ
jgi:hypothetical protein